MAEGEATLITEGASSSSWLCHMSYDCEQVRGSHLGPHVSSVSTGNTALPFQELS